MAKRRTKQLENEILRLRAANYSFEEVARKLGCSRGLAHKVCAESRGRGRPSVAQPPASGELGQEAEHTLAVAGRALRGLLEGYRVGRVAAELIALDVLVLTDTSLAGARLVLPEGTWVDLVEEAPKPARRPARRPRRAAS